ncbi:MAG: G5 domain-containing protein, partial [Turicibacter sp.]
RSIELSQNDEISVARTSTVEEEMEIEITRVEKEYESVFEEITLDVEYVYTDDVPSREQEVYEEGSPKVIEHVIEKVYKNGEQVDEYEVETKVIDEGVARTVAVGTGPLASFVANMTAYNVASAGGSKVACKPYPDVSASIYWDDNDYGQVRVVAASKDLPCGTIVDMDGIGKAIVLDRGSAITGDDLDLLVNTNPWDFGRKYKTTKVLRWGW